MHRLAELVRLHRQRLCSRQAARLLKMIPNTERRYRLALQEEKLLEGPVDEEPDLGSLREAVEARLPSTSAPQHESRVSNWTDAVSTMLDHSAEPTAISDRLRLENKDFAGGLSAIKRLVRHHPRSIAAARSLRRWSCASFPCHAGRVDVANDHASEGFPRLRRIRLG